LRAQPRVTGIGNCALDLLAGLDRYPGPDERVTARRILEQGGGEAATAMVTLARLGISTAFIGKIGDDWAGAAIRQGLEAEGVDASGLVVEPGRRSLFSFIAVENATGRRTIFSGRTTTRLKPSELARDFPGSSEVVHLDQRETRAGPRAAARARRAGARVTLDVDRFEPATLKLVRATQVVLASGDFGRQAGPDPLAAAARVRELGPETVVFTYGDRGALVSGREGAFFQPAFRVRPVDTTGAGDVFRGAFIYGLLQEWPLERTARFASAAAALKCTRPGGRTGIPGLERVILFLEERRNQARPRPLRPGDPG